MESKIIRENYVLTFASIFFCDPLMDGLGGKLMLTTARSSQTAAAFSPLFPLSNRSTRVGTLFLFKGKQHTDNETPPLDRRIGWIDVYRLCFSLLFFSFLFLLTILFNLTIRVIERVSSLEAIAKASTIRCVRYVI